MGEEGFVFLYQGAAWYPVLNARIGGAAVGRRLASPWCARSTTTSGSQARLAAAEVALASTLRACAQVSGLVLPRVGRESAHRALRVHAGSDVRVCEAGAAGLLDGRRQARSAVGNRHLPPHYDVQTGIGRSSVPKPYPTLGQWSADRPARRWARTRWW